MVRLKLGDEARPRKCPPKRTRPPYRFHPNGLSFESEVDFVTGQDPELLAHRLRNHDLPLRAYS
jgi:hypothetical protein